MTNSVVVKVQKENEELKVKGKISLWFY